MAKAYQINEHYGIVLVDSGKVIPLSDGGLLDSKDPEVLLELLLTAAVELNHLRSQLTPTEEDVEIPWTDRFHAPPTQESPEREL